MNLFFDTSVLVASAVRHHPHHPPAFAALTEITSGRHRGFAAAHTLAETYAVLTRLPLDPPVHCSEAQRMIEENILAHFRLLAASIKDYREVVGQIAAAGLTGGIVYDALILRCAQKQLCDRIYTFNVSHFRRLAPHWEKKICAPS
jgi:predicted nucleic acid-binding protein